MSKNSKAAPLILLVFLLLFVLIVIIGVYYYSQNAKVNNKTNLKDNSSQVGEDSALQGDKVIRDVESKNYQELKQQYPDAVFNPNISDAKMKEDFNSLVKNENPENYRMFYDGSALEPESIIIFQGDYVTWTNNSDANIVIKGEDDWGSFLEIQPQQGFSQEFDFIGDYEFSLVSGDSTLATGTITVKSAK